MKKLLAMILALCMVLAIFAGCSASPSDSDDTKKPAGNSSSQNKDDDKDPDKDDDKDPDKDDDKDPDKDDDDSKKVTIEETVIYDENNIKITAKGLYETDTGFGLTMKLENNSDKKASFYLNYCIINGFQVMVHYGNLAADAGKEKLGSFVFEDTDVEYLGKKYWGIESIATIAGANAQLTVDGEKIPVPFTITTSAGVGYEPTFDDSGDKVYEKDGVTVIYKEVIETEIGDALTLLVINETGRDFIVESVDGVVNGQNFGLPLSDYVYNGAIRCCHIILQSSSLEHKGIDKVENVRFAIGITDPETYRMVAKSDEIEIVVTE